MDFHEFVQRNNLVLPKNVMSLCNEGIEIMRRNNDLIHSVDHVLRIFDDLDRFLNEEKTIEEKTIDFKVLLLAISWHDSWRSRIFATTVASLVFCLLWDGIGGAQLFNRRAHQVGLDIGISKAASYCIYKHATFQILPTRTLEAKIVRDLDNLEEWSLQRLRSLEQQFLAAGKVDRNLLRLAKFYFDTFMRNRSDALFYFQWSKKEFIGRKRKYLEKVDSLFSQYGN